MFDYDYPGEGFKGMLALEVTSPAEIQNVLKSEARRISRFRDISHETSGFKPLQGVIWYPAEDNDEDDLPIILSKLFTVKASDQPPEYDIDVFPQEAPNKLRQQFLAALAEARGTGEVTSELDYAFRAVLPDDVSAADNKWVLRELSFSEFGVLDKQLVVRKPRSEPITLSELANCSTARGSWFQVRHGDDIDEPRFSVFDDDDRCGPYSCNVMLKPRQGPAAEDEPDCMLETDWIQRGPSTAVRYLAVGAEPRLSW